MNNKKNLTFLLIVFMIIQPILDIYYLYTEKIINFFKLSPATIVRIIFLGLMLILSFMQSKSKQKSRHLVFLIIIYILYITFHHLNAVSFIKSTSMYSKYNFIKEVFYIVRMIIPFGIIYTTKESNLSNEDVKKIVYSVINIFSITIIITNFLGISLTSYASGSGHILANFFKWFNSNAYDLYTYEYVASKGIFHMANQISATLICLFPIELYYIYKEKITIGKVLTLILNILTFLMIGTRVASYGWLFVILFVTIEYIYSTIKSKEKIIGTKILLLGIISLITILIIPYSPVANRTYASDHNNIIQEQIKNSNGEFERQNLNCFDKDDCYNKKNTYINKYYDIYGFDLEFINEHYDYHEDPDFWFNLFNVPFLKRANHRQIKTLITHRVMELNNNKWDYLFGLTFTRLRGMGIYMENDIYVHLYSIGIIGMLLLIFPYLYIAGYAIYKLIKYQQNSFSSYVYLTSICLVFCAGIVSGNVFDELIVTIFLGFICGLLLKETSKEVNMKKKVLFISSTGGHLEELMQLKSMFQDYDYHIITEKTTSNLSLKNKYPKRVNYLVFGTYTTLTKKLTYPFKLLYNTIKSFILYLIIRPKYIISTGTHTAGPMCLIGHIFGSKVIFIETFANSSTRSRTGNLVYKFADLFIVQWESMLEVYPNAIYGGWIF